MRLEPRNPNPWSVNTIMLNEDHCNLKYNRPAQARAGVRPRSTIQIVTVKWLWRWKQKWSLKRRSLRRRTTKE